jgi:diphthamide synthase subunit DPH2
MTTKSDVTTRAVATNKWNATSLSLKTTRKQSSEVNPSNKSVSVSELLNSNASPKLSTHAAAMHKPAGAKRTLRLVQSKHSQREFQTKRERSERNKQMECYKSISKNNS